MLGIVGVSFNEFFYGNTLETPDIYRICTVHVYTKTHLGFKICVFSFPDYNLKICSI